MYLALRSLLWVNTFYQLKLSRGLFVKRNQLIVEGVIALLAWILLAQNGFAQSVSATDVAAVWRKQIVVNAECVGNVKNDVTLRPDEIERGALPANFQNPLRFKITEIGYRIEGFAGAESLASTTNGSSITAYPFTDIMPLRMVTKYPAGKGGHESLAVTGALLLWANPMKTRYGIELLKLGEATLQISDSQPFGPCVHLVLGKATVTLAQKWGWRVVCIADDENGKPVSRQHFEYAHSPEGKVFLKKFTHSMLFAGIESGFEIDSVTFGNVILSDIEVKIPPQSLLTETVNGEEKQTVIRSDGTERRFTADEAVSGATWNEVINSETGKLPTKKRAVQKSYWTTIGLGLGGLMIVVAIVLAIIKKSKGD
jgi:hypothetical protein